MGKNGLYENFMKISIEVRLLFHGVFCLFLKNCTIQTGLPAPSMSLTLPEWVINYPSSCLLTSLCNYAAFWEFHNDSPQPRTCPGFLTHVQSYATISTWTRIGPWDSVSAHVSPSLPHQFYFLHFWRQPQSIFILISLIPLLHIFTHITTSQIFLGSSPSSLSQPIATRLLIAFLYNSSCIELPKWIISYLNITIVPSRGFFFVVVVFRIKSILNPSSTFFPTQVRQPWSVLSYLLSCHLLYSDDTNCLSVLKGALFPNVLPPPLK